jgi:hypothetical protein
MGSLLQPSSVATIGHAVRRGPRYDEPFFWWGPGWETRHVRSIGDLLRDGTIDPATAAILWAGLARRKSLAVVAGPSGTGKTTLLSALLEFLPPGTRRIYPRGCFETFAFLSDPAVVPEETALLVNEISAHLPIYLWGPAVERMLATTERGFCLFATAHAASITTFVGTLTGSPLRIPASRLAAFEFVAIMEPTAESASGRRVSGLWRLGRSRDGVKVSGWPLGSLHNISHENSAQPSHSPLPWFPFPELLHRHRLLAALRAGEIDSLPVDAATVDDAQEVDLP